MKIFFNNQLFQDVKADIVRVTAHKATAREVRRAFSRLFPEGVQNLTIVYDLDQGISPRRAEFEQMADKAAESLKWLKFDDPSSGEVDVKRSPKYGKVTLTVELPDWRDGDEACRKVIREVSNHHLYHCHYRGL